MPDSTASIAETSALAFATGDSPWAQVSTRDAVRLDAGILSGDPFNKICFELHLRVAIHAST